LHQITTIILMKRILYVYGIAYFVLLMFVVGLLFIYPKMELHMLLNSYHTNFLDSFFKHYTFLAEGPLYAIALLPIIRKNIRIIIFFALCELTGGLILQILKRTINSDRPVVFFEKYHSMVLPFGWWSNYAS